VGRCINTNGGKTINLKLAGVTIATVSELAAETHDWIIEAWLHVESATVAAGTVRVQQGTTNKAFDYLQSGVSLSLSTTDPVILLTGQLGNGSDTITVNQFKVQLTN
jgi:hypothetical protein